MFVWSFKSFIRVVCQNPSWGRITDISHGEWKEGEGGVRPLMHPLLGTKPYKSYRDCLRQALPASYRGKKLRLGQVGSLVQCRAKLKPRSPDSWLVLSHAVALGSKETRSPHNS